MATPYNTYRSKKEQVEEMFDHIAPKYDLLNQLLSLGVHKRWRKRTIREVTALSPNNILDVATGTGDLAIQACGKTGAKITAIDLSEQMLSAGRKKVEAKGLSEQIEFMKADCEALPFADDSFDAVMVAFGVRNFGDLDKGLKEMHRVLRPGKKIYVLEFSKISNGFFRALFRFYFKTVCPIIGKLISADKRAYTYLPESVEEFPSGGEFAKIMERCAYREVKVCPLSMGIATLYTGVK